ncbi:flagellar basal body-associated FliL family protein [Sphingomonas sp.]|uniref:flagellar basal body-associated FliL family protein n=1 Tax=Sphingomonas sp. TaxID=28214 RepID=UPI001EC3E2D2|nr:flagellar basal body-associated FliL family protein [Sphingomonas sp.]MBX3595294.1 flagellar basal body-associated FliL family protein [Sphingomonas sp.]
MSDDKAEAAPKKKKGGAMKWVLIGTGLVVLVGGGVGGGLYAASSGLIGGGGAHAEAAAPDQPHLVPKSEEVRASVKGEGGGEGGEGGAGGGLPTPKGSGGDKYASTYYAMEKEFTSNLRESVHFIQIGIAISTPYDNRVIENLKTHEMAVRSAVLMALGETSEDDVFSADGKKALQKRLAVAINGVLKEKEGFGGVSNVYFTNFIVQ